MKRITVFLLLAICSLVGVCSCDNKVDMYPKRGFHLSGSTVISYQDGVNDALDTAALLDQELMQKGEVKTWSERASIVRKRLHVEADDRMDTPASQTKR
jgi:hypothetical protein